MGKEAIVEIMTHALLGFEIGTGVMGFVLFDTITTSVEAASLSVSIKLMELEATHYWT